MHNGAKSIVLEEPGAICDKLKTFLKIDFAALMRVPEKIKYPIYHSLSVGQLKISK